MTPTEVQRELGVDVALRWGTGYDTTVRSFVNIIATPKGGTHVAGFERALVRTLNEQLRAAALLQGGEDDGHQGRRHRGPDGGRDRPAGRAAVRGPDQGGAGHLGGLQHRRPCGRARAQGALRPTAKRGAKQQPRAVLEKVVAAARARIAARQHKEPQRRKNALENSVAARQAGRLPQRRRRPQRAVHRRGRLGAGHGQARPATREFQALLPIRGKILNVQKASVADMLKNAECARDHPGRSEPGRAAPSTSTRPATARSS